MSPQFADGWKCVPKCRKNGSTAVYIVVRKWKGKKWWRITIYHCLITMLKYHPCPDKSTLHVFIRTHSSMSISQQLHQTCEKCRKVDITWNIYEQGERTFIQQLLWCKNQGLIHSEIQPSNCCLCLQCSNRPSYPCRPMSPPATIQVHHYNPIIIPLIIAVFGGIPRHTTFPTWQHLASVLLIPIIISSAGFQVLTNGETACW